MSRGNRAIIIILIICCLTIIPRVVKKYMPEENMFSSGIEIHKEETEELLQVLEENEGEEEENISEDATSDESKRKNEADNAEIIENAENYMDEEYIIQDKETDVISEDKEVEIEKNNEESVHNEENANICFLTVSCMEALEKIEKLKATIPENGIYVREEVEFEDGDSVFDVLYRILRKNKVQFDFNESKLHNSVYIKGIGNLYEFDLGGNSGWLYRVNGEKPNCGASQYIVNKGDNIEFYYSVNYMKDK